MEIVVALMFCAWHNEVMHKSHLYPNVVVSDLYEIYSSFSGEKLKQRPMKSGHLTVNVRRSKEKRHRPHLAHRVIWECVKGEIPKGMQIDHINGNPSDNSITNLRCVTQSGNQRAYNKPPKGASKYRGVSKMGKSWRAYIGTARQQHVGCFKTEKDAAVARDKKAEELGFPKEGLNRYLYPNEFACIGSEK